MEEIMALYQSNNGIISDYNQIPLLQNKNILV